MHRPIGPHRSPRRPPSSLRTIVPTLVGLACLAGCGADPAPETSRSAGRDSGLEEAGLQEDGRAIVAVSILPIAGIAEALLPPDVASISVLVPAGSDPHSFEPGIGQLKKVQNASVVLEVGHPALVWERGWLEGLLSGSEAVRVRLSDGCDVIEDDPHVWLDPACLQIMAVRAADGLITAFPDRSGEIRTRLEGLRAGILKAEAGVRDRVADRRGRSFLVQHPAWGYFGRAFGLEQISILSHGSSDRGSARLAYVIDRAKKENLRIVIVQPQVNPEAAQVVAREIGAEVRQVDPMARNPLDALESITLAVLEATAP